MITAHAPSGYVLSRLWPRAGLAPLACFIGAILPDFDLIWFYFIDDRAFHHHRYWVHIPAFWAICAAIVLPALWAFKRDWTGVFVAFIAGIFLHICLDTISGDILWHWPFSDEFTHLITVTPRFDHWILNFLIHPVFALELAIWIWAFYLFRSRP